jgi:hypothetical protein
VREVVDLEYRDGSRTLSVGGELTGPRWKQINILMSGNRWDQQALDGLAAALREHGYEYLIYTLGEEQTIPEAERDAALAELQSMGYQIEVSPDRKRIRQSLAKGANSPPRDEAKKTAPRMMKLIQTLRGTRRPMQVLRKSDSAEI